MKSVVALITLALVAAGAPAGAQEMIEVLPLACLFGPSHGDQIVTFAALGFSGLAAIGGGITLTALGGSKLRQLHRPISLRLSGNGVSLSGPF